MAHPTVDLPKPTTPRDSYRISRWYRSRNPATVSTDRISTVLGSNGYARECAVRYLD